MGVSFPRYSAGVDFVICFGLFEGQIIIINFNFIFRIKLVIKQNKLS